MILLLIKQTSVNPIHYNYIWHNRKVRKQGVNILYFLNNLWHFNLNDSNEKRQQHQIYTRAGLRKTSFIINYTKDTSGRHIKSVWQKHETGRWKVKETNFSTSSLQYRLTWCAVFPQHKISSSWATWIPVFTFFCWPGRHLTEAIIQLNYQARFRLQHESNKVTCRVQRHVAPLEGGVEEGFQWECGSRNVSVKMNQRSKTDMDYLILVHLDPQALCLWGQMFNSRLVVKLEEVFTSLHVRFNTKWKLYVNKQKINPLKVEVTINSLYDCICMSKSKLASHKSAEKPPMNGNWYQKHLL